MEIVNKMEVDLATMEHKWSLEDPLEVSCWEREVPGSKGAMKNQQSQGGCPCELIRGTDPPRERVGHGPGSHPMYPVRLTKRREEGSYRHLVPVLTAVDIGV